MTTNPGETAETQVPETEMLRQMFAATVHNIGNVITVASLALNELEESNTEKAQVMEMLLGELLPTLERQVEAGTVGHFLSDDPTGQEYPAAMRQLLEHQQKIMQEQAETVDALNKKLEHVSEVIRLQQHMLAGLGRREETTMPRMVEDALKLMSESVSRHHVEVVCEHQAACVFVAESPMIVQILVNLMKNAIEALDEVESPIRRMTIRTGERERDGGTYQFCEISDTGPGISQEALERLFEFGFTTKSHTKGGQGVGLHFCRRTLEGQGGWIDAGNSDDGGAWFAFGLPRHAPHGAN